MKSLVFLRKYNNYYNRKVKKQATLEDYLLNNDYVIKSNINFTPGDGVNTSLITAWAEEWTADYMILVDDMNEIVSRWFILDNTRTLNGQYRVNLRRDLIADHLEQLIDAPVFVQKANLEPESPLIYNPEGLEYNQIKTKEFLLKDETKTPWIVGYVDKSYTADGADIKTTINRDGITTLESLGLIMEDIDDPQAGGIFNIPEGDVKFRMDYNYVDTAIPENNDLTQTIETSFNALSGVFMAKRAFKAQNSDKRCLLSTQFFADTSEKIAYVLENWDAKFKENRTSVVLALQQYLLFKETPFLDNDELETILQLNEKVVFSNATGKYYKMILGLPTLKTTKEVIATNSFTTSLRTVYKFARDAIVSGAPSKYKFMAIDDKWQIEYKASKYTVSFIEVPGPGEFKVNIKSGHATLKDAPYNMFAMPFNESNMELANAIVKKLTKSIIYDLQILPYCPMRYMMDEDGVDLSLGMVDINYNNITIGETNISYLLWGVKSSDSFVIFKDIAKPQSPEEIKIANETEFIRLNSPNYSGSFDFNVAKNQGVDYFKVSFTYKPISPYIQVAPNFKGLYGSDFGDARGLICGGDFSVAMTTDAWNSYQINNKNFDNIFNTEIKTMDYAHRMSMISGGIGGGLQAAGLGVGAGVMSGNPFIGAAAGMASAAGGAADLAIGHSVYQSNKQGKVDMFNYQLGNIKARPDTLNKVSAYNVNNKYFPFLEYYEATETEKQALLNKIKYEGMTVMTIGTIREYLGAKEEFNFFKGQLIQNYDIAENFQILDAIGVELEKGVYL